MQRSLVWLALALIFTGCAKKEAGSVSAASTSATKLVAPHGGTLVALGLRQYFLEFVHDSDSGALTVWALDGLADSPVSLAQASISVQAGGFGAEDNFYTLTAVGADSAGAKLKNDSCFVVSDPRLRMSGPLAGKLGALQIGTEVFRDTSFALPARARTLAVGQASL